MDFALTREQVAFRDAVRSFCAEHVTDELRRITGTFGDEHHPAFYAKLAERGWIGMQWPRAYGGQGKSHTEMVLFYEEMALAGAPLGRYNGSVVFVGSSIIEFGSEEQKKKYLPRIANGELTFCWCLSEPNAGSDSASLRTMAREDDEHFVVNGQKVFISGAHVADYAMVAVRTNPTAPKREGISLILLDMSSAGITVNPIWTIGGWRVNEVFFENVRVSKEQLLGEKDKGWSNLLKTLNFERSGISTVGNLMRFYDELVEHVRSHAEEIPEEDQMRLAEMKSHIEAARLFSYRVAYMQSQGQIPDSEASVAKLCSSELSLQLGSLGMDLLGRAGVLGDETAPLHGDIERLYRAAQFYLTGGGTPEIQRNLIARRGLDLPRSG